MQELERALGGARVGAMRKAEIAVDDADEGKAGKVVALGDDLRADDDIEFARLDAADHLAHFGQAGDEIGRQQRQSRIREALRHFLCTRSMPGPQATSEPGAAHFGHFSGSDSEKPQWWQFSRFLKRCSTSQAVHCGHSRRWPHERQSVSGA